MSENDRPSVWALTRARAISNRCPAHARLPLLGIAADLWHALGDRTGSRSGLLRGAVRRSTLTLEATWPIIGS
jgi:hypothetical protein